MFPSSILVFLPRHNRILSQPVSIIFTRTSTPTYQKTRKLFPSSLLVLLRRLSRRLSEPVSIILVRIRRHSRILSKLVSIIYTRPTPTQRRRMFPSYIYILVLLHRHNRRLSKHLSIIYTRISPPTWLKTIEACFNHLYSYSYTDITTYRKYVNKKNARTSTQTSQKNVGECCHYLADITKYCRSLFKSPMRVLLRRNRSPFPSFTLHRRPYKK